MCFEVRIAEELNDPVFAATLRTELGHTIIVARSDGWTSGSDLVTPPFANGCSRRASPLRERGEAWSICF